MPRPSKSPLDRAIDIDRAAGDLPALIGRALDVSARDGYDSPEARRAWESVEVNGATVHRQARILAGKSRGG